VARRDARGAHRAPHGYAGGGPPSPEGSGYPPGVLSEPWPPRPDLRQRASAMTGTPSTGQSASDRSREAVGSRSVCTIDMRPEKLRPPATGVAKIKAW